jgi:surface carbohydrate biosynthesis protein (TIGR04326 family)
MIIWDQDGAHEDTTEEMLCWRSYACGDKVYSVPGYLEDNAERLRSKYAAFIYDLGESYIGDKRIVEHLNISDGFSFWWMNQVSEKSPFKSPRIYDCLRLLALEEILIEKSPKKLILVSSDVTLSKVVKKLCRELNINFDWEKRKKNKQQCSLHHIYYLLPTSIQGLLSFRYLLLRWPLRKLTKPKWGSGDNAIFFCSYFFNLDVERCFSGEFYSRQWEKLPDFLHTNGKCTNWIHHFLISPGVPNNKIGLNWLKQFNRDAEKQGNHSFLESYLTWGIALKTFKSWLKLNVLSWRLRNIHTNFTVKNSSVWLWPFLARDWKTSIIGPIAFNNCLWFELFNAVFKDMTYQKLGLYLWENQGWEAAMVHAWHHNGHGKIIGVPHATTVFWHLNNFDDPRTFTNNEMFSKPLPDLLAVNGPMARQAFIDTLYPVERLVEVEALRFQYLKKLINVKQKRKLALPPTDGSSNTKSDKRVLILGDFTVTQTHKMLKIFEEAVKQLTTNISVTVKLHPACAINLGDYSNLLVEETDQPLAEIIHDFDIAFSSNTTSAGLDALLAGLCVAVFLDDNDFNHSPLRGIDGVKYVSCAKELTTVLEKGARNKIPPSTEKFFCLDDDFNKWQKLLLNK